MGNPDRPNHGVNQLTEVIHLSTKAKDGPHGGCTWLPSLVVIGFLA